MALAGTRVLGRLPASPPGHGRPARIGLTDGRNVAVALWDGTSVAEDEPKYGVRDGDLPARPVTWAAR